MKSACALQRKTYDEAAHGGGEMAKRSSFKQLGRSLQTEEAVGARLDRYLAQQYPFKQRLAWRQAVVEGRVRVRHGRMPPRPTADGGEGGEGEEEEEEEETPLEQLRVVKRHYRLRLYDQLFLYFPQAPGPAVARPGVLQQTRVLAAEGDLLALHKPAHLVVHPTGLHRHSSLQDAVRELGFPDHLPVHRLDRETSGVVLAARSSEVRAALHAAFQRQEMAKMYLCVVRPCLEAAPGAPPPQELPDSFRVTARISNVPGLLTRIKRTVEGGRRGGADDEAQRQLDEEAQSAATTFVRVAALPDSDHELLACMPETGRTHQLRVHLAALGYWIIGDKVYHRDEQLFHTWRADGDTEEVLRRLQHERQLLHHAAIQAPPSLAPLLVAREPILSPVPEDMREFAPAAALLREASRRLALQQRAGAADGLEELASSVPMAVWHSYRAGAYAGSPVVL